MINILSFKNITLGITTLFTLGAITFSQVISANAAASLQGGDFFQAFNNTAQAGTWTDPVTGQSGQIIEFRVTARNSGDEVAENVQVWGSITGQVPQDPANTNVLTARISNSNFGGAELTDTVTVNVSGNPEGMRYVNGHARLNGVTNLFNCPNTCDIGDSVLGGINVGNIAAGDFVEVTYKATLTNTPVVTPTPTPTVQVTPTPTPTVSITPTPTPTTAATPTPTPTTTQQGNTNTNTNTNTQSQSQTNTQSQTATTGSSSSTSSSSSNSNVTVNNPNPQVVTVVKETQVAGVSTTKELPKTGLPLLAWAAAAFLPAGARLRKFNQVSKGLISANYIWEEREFKINS